MKDLDSKLICEAYTQVMESDQLTWTNTLANKFVAVGEKSLVNVSKNQMKKYFQKYIEDNGIANDPAKVEMLDREDDKGEKARQKLFMNVLQDLRGLYGDREPEPELEPEPIPIPEPESEPEPIIEPEEEEEEEETWLDRLKQGRIRVPQLPKIKFK